jgi:DNA-binding Lrp family transcriptional regulator
MKADKKLILELSKPFALSPRPFKNIARRLGRKESDIISAIDSYRKKGIIRRFGAVFAHKNIGLKTNALVAWKVNPDKISSVAKIISGFGQISHCYLRNTYAEWPYNIYSMVHAPDRKTCLNIIKDVAKKSQTKGFKVLFTLKELKKTKQNLAGAIK